MKETLSLILVNIILIFVLYFFKNSIDLQTRQIPRDISEHSEIIPTYAQVYSAIRNEPSKWVSTFEKERIVSNAWLSQIM